MSVIVTYKCDKCKCEQTDSEQFWAIGVGWGSYNRTLSVSKNYTLQLCRPCLALFGLVPSRDPGVKTPEPPTTEDLIIEVLERCRIFPTE